MTRVDFKQGVLQGGSGKLEKWVPCCQKSTGAGDIVLKRACSVFKRPHKTLTALPLFTLTPQSTKKYEIPGRRKPQPVFCPVLTLLSLKCHITSLFHIPHHALLRSVHLKKENKVIYSRLSCFLPSPNLRLLLIPWLSLAVNFFSFYPHQKPGQGWPQHSRVARGEHLCLPERWHRACLFEFHCDVYMESSVSAEQMYLAPHIKSLPHSLSRFHILFHITETDKRGSVYWDLREARHFLLNTAPIVEVDQVNKPLWPCVRAATLRRSEFLQWTVSFSFATPTDLK